jgi:S1-C subfamily serine protease
LSSLSCLSENGKSFWNKNGGNLKLLILICFLAVQLINITFAQLGQLPLDKVIDNIKPCIVAIEARDDTVLAIQNNDTIRYSSYGSGVMIVLDSNDVYALTNEHVVAIKNQTNNKTIRYAKNIMVSYNVKGFGAISFPRK